MFKQLMTCLPETSCVEKLTTTSVESPISKSIVNYFRQWKNANREGYVEIDSSRQVAVGKSPHQQKRRWTGIGLTLQMACMDSRLEDKNEEIYVTWDSLVMKKYKLLLMTGSRKKLSEFHFLLQYSFTSWFKITQSKNAPQETFTAELKETTCASNS